MNNKFRCDCPVTSALDLVGDKWTLVIVKQMLIEEKKTFKDFLESEESIATNILSSRLKMLEEYQMLTKEKLPNNKKTNIYKLTDKGLGLIPVVIELIIWSDNFIRDFHLTLMDNEQLDYIKTNKSAFAKTLKERYIASF